MRRVRNSGLAPGVRLTVLLLGLMFLALAVEAVFQLPLRQFGIRPRTTEGLVGIFVGPILHGNLQHLLTNSVPFTVLLVLLWGDRAYRPAGTLAWIWLGSGLGTWLIGRGAAVHIGASGVVFGMVAFLVVEGLRLKSWRSAIIAIVVFLLYGGIFYGVLPQRGLVSWEGHLCGALAGVFAAVRLPR